jgi:hypothetical protein
VRVVAFVLALCPSALFAQDLRERSLEAEQRMLEQERRERQEQRPNVLPQLEKRRDESCREADIFIRQNC